MRIRYHYDGLNRLAREDNAYIDKTVVYCYDEEGDILSKTEYSLTFEGDLGEPLDTINYSYSNGVWRNALTGYDGEVIFNDPSGNPLTYRGYSLEWAKGRQLSTLSDDELSMQFRYNHSGIRTSKTVNGVKTEYTYVGSTLVSQKTGGEVINFAYTAGGAPLGFTYNGTPYFYLLNLQGDVIAVYDSTGEIVIEYTYDSWGKLISSEGSLAGTIGIKNPLRYRGYYYDVETGLYYLQSRYYDPETGRFLNPDAYLIAGNDVLQGTNMYAYCYNNPVMYSDPTGYNAIAMEPSFWSFFMATLSSIVASASPAVIIIGCIALVAITVAYISDNTTIGEETGTKVLADTTAQIPSNKAYQLAYVNSDGDLVRTGSKMTFTDALKVLGITGATNTLSKIYKYDKKNPTEEIVSLKSKSKTWGIYADNQSYAKALATVFGYNEAPKVHGSGYYGHYHDSTHSFHIWYGDKVYY